MNSQLSLEPLTQEDLGDYGLARVRDLAFDAVIGLWKQRQAEGMTQKEIVDRTGSSAATVSRNLRAPGNWTLRTLGELVYAMDGDLSFVVVPAEDVSPETNYDFYDELDDFDQATAAPIEIEFSMLSGPNSTRRPEGILAPLPKTEIIR